MPANNYPIDNTIFCPENVICVLHLLHILKCISDLLGSLIWVYIICNMGFLRTKADVCFCLLVLMLYIPVNNFSVMSGLFHVFLG